MNAEIAAKIDQLCDAFERAWKSGTEPDPVSLLSEVSEEMRIPLAQQLMLVDAEYRHKRDGTPLSLEFYAERFQVDVLHLQSVARSLHLRNAGLDTKTVLGPAAEDTVDNPRALNRERTAAANQKLTIGGYEILSELGRGGMGVVYKARQLRPGRIVALKTIHSPHLAGKEQILRFQAEAEAAGRLDHRGIVPVFEVGEDNGIHFFSMGFVDGINLEAKAREQVMSCREAASIVRDIAEALEYAHQHGVIHRDIKPQNILLDADGKPRITDFGLAKLTSSDAELTGSGQIMGTAAYMPPEQATGKTSSAGPTADVYAVGATLYRCITGRPPFQAASSLEILRQVVEDEPIAPRRLNKEIDADIEVLCLKCLEKDPEQRFQSAGELADELTRYLNGEPIRSRPIGSVRRAWRWCRRRPAVAAALMMAVVLLPMIAAGIPYLMWQQSQLRLAESERENREREQQIRNLESEKQLNELTAKNARERIEKERAQELAETQEYASIIRKVGLQQMQPVPGWTWTALADLDRASRLNAAGKDPVELRSLMIDILTSTDVREIFRLDGIRKSACMDVSRDGKLLALGDSRGVPFTNVTIYEIVETSRANGITAVSLNPIRHFGINTIGDKALEPFKVLGFSERGTGSEGFRSVRFSADGTHVAAGTRNARVGVWKIDSDPPQSIFLKHFDDPHDSSCLVDILPDLSRVYCSWQHADDRIFRVLDGASGELLQEVRDSTDFHAMLPDGRILLSQAEAIVRFAGNDPENRNSVAKPNARAWIFSVSDRPIVLLYDDVLRFFNPVTGEPGLQLDLSTGGALKLAFSADTALIAGADARGFVRLWDGLSGRKLQDLPFPSDEMPDITVHPSTNRLFLSLDGSVSVMELRGPETLRTNALAAERVPNSSIASTANGLSSLSEMPVNVFAPGATALTAFDLSANGEHLVTFEHFEDWAGTSNRTRIRKLETATGKQVNCWTSCIEGDWGTASKVIGADVSFLGDGEQIAVAASNPGSLLVLTDQGFTVPGGLGIDLVQQSTTSVEPTIAVWECPPDQLENGRSYRVAAAVWFPRALHQTQERVDLEFRCESRTAVYAVDERTIDGPGWYLLRLADCSFSELSAGCKVRATVTSDILTFASPGTAGDGQPEQIFAAELKLFPLRMATAGEGSIELGLVSGRGDGGLACCFNDIRVFQWNSDLSKPLGDLPWTDLFNSSAPVRMLTSGFRHTLVGTRSGVVGSFDDTGEFRLLRDGYSGGLLAADEITAGTITFDGRFAAAGTLGGQIRFFNLELPQNTPIHITDAHGRQLSALALTQDGQLLASFGEDHRLKFWKPHGDRLELLLEMSGNDAAITDLKFSPDGQFLYLLRSGERGVRRLNIGTIRDQFEILDLNW